MTRRLRISVALLAATLVLASGVFLSAHASAASSATAPTLLDQNGKVVSLDDYKDRPVVLNFWAVWCPPCLMEIPTFSAFAAANPNVAVLGVAVESGSAAELSQLKRELGIGYPVFLADQNVLAAYGVRGLPTTVIIEPGGKVSSVHTGMMSKRELENAVSRAQ